MTLIHCGIRRKEIKVFLSIHIPYIHTLTLVEHHWQRMIVVSTILFFQEHHTLRSGLFP